MSLCCSGGMRRRLLMMTRSLREMPISAFRDFSIMPNSYHEHPEIGANIMEMIPAAEFHAQEIDIYLTKDGTMAMLSLVGQAQRFSVSLPRPALERL